MASLGSKQLIWFRRCCSRLGSPLNYPCVQVSQPWGSIDMKYWVEVTGDYNPGTQYDTYTNLKAHFWVDVHDNGYFAGDGSCPNEDGWVGGCTDTDILYMNTIATGTSWRQIHSWYNARADRPSRDLGTFAISGTLTVPAGTTVNYPVARSYSCGTTTDFSLTFSKERPDMTECKAPTVTLSCRPSESSVYEGILDISGSWGTNIDRDGRNVLVQGQSWTVTPGNKTGTGSSVTGLQPNSTYSVKVTRNNGCASASATCSFTTLCGNQISNCRSTKSNEIQVDCTILGGYGVYAPTTSFRYRKYGTTEWKTIEFTTKTKTKTTVIFPDLERDTSYELQACTTTTAGTYCGNIISCRTVAGAFAIIDSADSYIDDNVFPPNTRAKVCYSWSADCAPVDLQVYYRVKNGADPNWLKSEIFTSDQASGSNCIVLVDLVPDYTVYECFVRATGCDGVSWDSPFAEFTTPALERPQGNNCETLQYMLELICQALEAVKEGNMNIFANKDSKDKCDPYSENPTMTTFWSRFLRWAGAATCLICDMVEFLIKSGKKDQYFVGEIGWVDILKHVEDEYDETDDDRLRLASSGAVYELIQRSLHAVWHYHGEVDYIVDNLDNVPSDAKTVINLADNKVYEKSGSSWKVSTKIDQPDDFSVYHIKNESQTAGVGKVDAESAYYYWDGTWNNLDGNAEGMDERLTRLEEHPEFVQTANPDTKWEIVDETFDFEKNGKEGVLYIVTEVEKAEPKYRTVSFETEGQSTYDVRSQQVPDGAYAQKPTDPTNVDERCDFEYWEEDKFVLTLTCLTPGTATFYNKWSYPILIDGEEVAGTNGSVTKAVKVGQRIKYLATEKNPKAFSSWLSSGNYTYGVVESSNGATFELNVPDLTPFLSNDGAAGSGFFYSFCRGRSEANRGAITKLTEGTFDTSMIATTYYNFFRAFNYYGSLTSLPEGSFDTSNITRAGMSFFYDFNCRGLLESLPDGSFRIDNITTVESEFFYCFNQYGALKALPDGSFNTANITAPGQYFFASFNNYGALTSLPDRSFNISNIESPKAYFFQQFNNAGALTSLPEGSFDTSNITSTADGFFSSFNAGGKIEHLPEGSFKIDSIVAPSGAFFTSFNGSGALIDLPEGSFNTSNITTVKSSFFNSFNSNGALTSLPEGSFNISKVSSVGSYFFQQFNYRGALTSLPEGSFDTSSIETVNGDNFFAQFNYEGKLTSLPEGSFNISKITEVKNKYSFFVSFNNGGALTSLPDGSFDTSNIIILTGDAPFSSFNQNGKLTSLPDGSFRFDSLEEAGTSFLSGFNSSGKLETLPDGSFNFPKLRATGWRLCYSFNNYGSLSKLPAGSFQFPSLEETGTYMFYNFNYYGSLESMPVGALSFPKLTAEKAGEENYFRNFNANGNSFKEGNKGVSFVALHDITAFNIGDQKNVTAGTTVYLNADED